jgi:hypothetical protein
MTNQTSQKKITRCLYVKVCYLTEAMKCFGYKTDCALFQKSNGMLADDQKFNQAMDSLINKTKAKFEQLP